jgi:hypothetical protein
MTRNRRAVSTLASGSFERPRFGHRSTLARLNRNGSGGVLVPALEELGEDWKAYHAAKQCLKQMGAAAAKMYGVPQS